MSCTTANEVAAQEQAPAFHARRDGDAAGNSPAWGRLKGRLGRLWFVVCMLAAMAFLGRAIWAPAKPAAPVAVHSGVERATPALQSIESIPVGQRVLTGPADGAADKASAVDPQTWRRLTLVAEDQWDDGTVDAIQVQTLQSPEWVAAHAAGVGAEVPIPLDLVEMGLPDDLRAKVVANEPCPPLQSGRGRVVLTTVNHLNDNVVEIAVTDGSRARLAIRPTRQHKFYSETRRRWVSAGSLERGERIRGLAETLQVCSIEAVPGVHRVYNMTVEGEHVYHVSGLGVLAHNNGCAQPVPGKITRDTAHMSAVARWWQRTETKVSVPWKQKPSRGMKDVVDFDDWDAAANQLIDRKWNVTRFAKSVNQARRQAEVARQHGVRVRWEVPANRVNAAEDLVERAEVEDIIQVVPGVPR